ncbi:venom dipeptidyl peptidase 4-like [Schistocerca nitens]|uniref:venom dipeptidyl peptidase 4-like n=1 Tax=Schistocerca nitens TaxID=7011 RepID=UPI0021199C45|nr:venom dipeptidyl peptidase 4-like [Schistocerca nitens]
MFAGCSVGLVRVVGCLMVVHTAAAFPVQKEPFGLEESISSDYTARTYYAQWISDTALLYVDEDRLFYYDLDTVEHTTLVPREVYSYFSPVKRALSNDWSFVLLGYDAEKVVGNAAVARYVVYSVKDNTTIHIGEGKRLQLAKWGPGNRLAYVYENDIYYLAEPTAEPLQVTTDGVPMAVYNGIVDDYGHLSQSASNTVGRANMLLWSPDGRRIAYGQYNASDVYYTAFEYYDSAGGGEYQYTRFLKFRYSKPGTPVATVHLRVATLPSDRSTPVAFQELLAPTDVVGHDHNLEDIVWTDNDILMASWKNRVENINQIVSYNTSKKMGRLRGQKGLKLERKDGWVDYKQLMPGYHNPSTYLIIDWEPQGEFGSFPHVVKVTGTSRTPITSGEFTVTDIYGWDDNGIVYYQATEEGQPSRRQVYAVREGASPRCLSCHVYSSEGNPCQRASADFSSDFTWSIFTCHGPDPPFLSVRYTAEFADISKDVVLNLDLRRSLSLKQLPQRLDDWVDVGDGMRAQVRMWLPPGLDPEGSEKRPAIVDVYAGPGSQHIDDSFEVGLHSYFATTRRYVYVLIDGRGSACKGDRVLFSVYRRLGGVEVQDQIDVTKRITEKYRFIDSSRVAIWGWSYGGYVTAMALARDHEGVFRCGASVAPVADWLYYDAKYTEKYMGLPTPEDNKAGYSASDVTRLADHFANKMFLLIHGTADDNVLYQNSMMLARALEEAGVLFRQQTYPDEYHWINGLRTHLYHTIDAFFTECFDEQSPSPLMKITQPPSPLVKTTYSPSPAEKATESPSPTEKTTQSPSPTEKTTQSPSPTDKTTQSPSPAEKTTQSPSPVEKTTQSPSPGEMTTQSPSPAEKTAQSPSPAEKTGQSPSPAEKTTQSPPPAEKTTQSPSPAEKTTQSPSPAEMTTQSPSPAEKTAQSPSPAEKTTQSPSPAVKTSQFPSSAVKTSQFSSSAVKTIQTPSSAV